jgi:hypothetical protein
MLGVRREGMTQAALARHRAAVLRYRQGALHQLQQVGEQVAHPR